MPKSEFWNIFRKVSTSSSRKLKLSFLGAQQPPTRESEKQLEKQHYPATAPHPPHNADAGDTLPSSPTFSEQFPNYDPEADVAIFEKILFPPPSPDVLQVETVSQSDTTTTTSDPTKVEDGEEGTSTTAGPDDAEFDDEPTISTTISTAAPMDKITQQARQRRIRTTRSMEYDDGMEGVSEEERAEMLKLYQRARRAKKIPVPSQPKASEKSIVASTITSSLRAAYIEAKYTPKDDMANLKKVVDRHRTLKISQGRDNKASELRLAHKNRETIYTTYFENHYDEFGKPPFKAIGSLDCKY